MSPMAGLVSSGCPATMLSTVSSPSFVFARGSGSFSFLSFCFSPSNNATWATSSRSSSSVLVGLGSSFGSFFFIVNNGVISLGGASSPVHRLVFGPSTGEYQRQCPCRPWLDWFPWDVQQQCCPPSHPPHLSLLGGLAPFPSHPFVFPPPTTPPGRRHHGRHPLFLWAWARCLGPFLHR